MKQKQMNWKYQEQQKCWLLEQVVYCNNPENIEEQCMNIYVPEEYLDKEGKLNKEGSRGGYTPFNAPVIFENGLAGYMQAEPFSLTDDRSMGEELIPGNMERIISVGISAGGAMSTLLGCTGDGYEYDSELEKMGAVLDESDAIFGAQCYCPITDLDYADFAYEWMFEGKSDYTGMPFVGFEAGTLSAFCQALSKKMGKRYIEYFNHMNLTHPVTGEHLLLEAGKQGSGAAFLKEKLEQSAEKFIRKKLAAQETLPDYFWLNWNGEKAKITSLEDMETDYHKRLKLCPAFDDLDLIQAENQEFGTSKEDKRHFNTELAEIMEELREKYPEEVSCYLDGYKKIIGDQELEWQKRLLNPLNFIPRKGENESSVLAPYYRIRVGAKDADTSLTVTMLLALRLIETNKTQVDYEIVWDEPHGRADYPGEMMAWVKKICPAE